LKRPNPNAKDYLHVYVYRHQIERLSKIAHERRTTKSAIVRELIDNYYFIENAIIHERELYALQQAEHDRFKRGDPGHPDMGM
jgi:predicted DNA-binding protein